MKQTLVPVSLALAASLIAACGTLSQPGARPAAGSLQSQSAPQITFASQASPLRAQEEAALRSVTADSLVFAKPVRAFRIGEILIGRAQGQDFLRRVTGVEDRGERISLATEPAGLHDAFEKLDARGFRPEDPQLLSKEIVFKDKKVKIGGIAEVITTLRLTPDFSDARIKIDKKKLFLRVAPATGMVCDVTTRLTLFTTANPLSIFNFPTLPPAQPIGQAEFNAVTVPGWIGPVPIVFHVTPGVALDLSHKASGELVIGSEISGQAKAGLELEAELGEVPVPRTFHQQAFQGHFREPALELKGSAYLRLTAPYVQVDTQIAGMVGPYVKIGTYIDGKAHQSATVKPSGTLLKGAVKSDLGAAMYGGITATKIFGKQIAQGIHAEIFNKTLKELYFKEFEKTIPHP